MYFCACVCVCVLFAVLVFVWEEEEEEEEEEKELNLREVKSEEFCCLVCVNKCFARQKALCSRFCKQVLCIIYL